MRARTAPRVSGGTGTATNRRQGGSATVLGAPALAVRRQHLQGPRVVAPAHHVNGLVLEQLVRVEEVLDLDQAMRPDLLEPFDVLLVRIPDGDAQGLEVEPLLVPHLEPADRPRPD